MRAASALATPGSSSAAPGLSMVRSSRRDTWLAIDRSFAALFAPVLFTPRGMAHYSRGGGDPNIVQHGARRRHAHVRRWSRPPGIGCTGDTMVKIPLTFACGLYDRMLA